MKWCAAVMLVMMSSGVFAAQRFLVPIHLIEPVNGAFGSRWASELTILNTGSSAAYIQNYGTCPPTGGPCVNPIYPQVAEVATAVRDFDFTIPAAVLAVDDQYVNQLVFSARVRDLSRSAQNWGTWLPVVPESAAVHEPLALVDIPVTAGFRQTLRIYSFDLAADRAVRVRVYGAVPLDPANPSTYLNPNPLLGEAVVPLRYAPRFGGSPLYAEVGDLTAISAVAGHDKVWLTIEPLGDFKLWGMVSITNNTTQEITMIVPHRSH
jgi:hypothetical protein